MLVAMNSFDVIVNFYNNIEIQESESLKTAKSEQKNVENRRIFLEKFSKKYPSN